MKLLNSELLKNSEQNPERSVARPNGRAGRATKAT